MSRQPVQRDLFEQLRRQSEVMRTDEIAASERINDRNNRALVAAVDAQRQTDAAAAAAAAATAEAASATAASQQAAGAAAAATAGAASANDQVAAADVQIARIGRSRVVSAVASGRVDPAIPLAFQNSLDLAASGEWGGMKAIVRVVIPLARSQTYAYQHGVDLRLDGVSVARRDVRKVPGTLTLAYGTVLGPGTHRFEVWWRAEAYGFVIGDGGQQRGMTITLIG